MTNLKEHEQYVENIDVGESRWCTLPIGVDNGIFVSYSCGLKFF